MPKAKFWEGDVLENVDILESFLNIEDFIAAMVAMGFTRGRANAAWVAGYGFVGSMVGRKISMINFGDGTIGTVLNAAQIQNDALISSLVQAGLQTALSSGRFSSTQLMTNFERSAATQVIAKCVGRKLAVLSGTRATVTGDPGATTGTKV